MEPTARTLPLAKMMLVFLGVLLAANGLLILVQTLLPGIDMPSSIGMVLMMVASISAGGTAATALGRPLVRQEKLRFASAATMASLALTGLLLWGLFTWNGVPLTLETLSIALTGGSATSADVLRFLPWIGLAVVMISLLVCYLGAGFGAKSQLRALERRAAQGK